jgi:PAS domain-containing protein
MLMSEAEGEAGLGPLDDSDGTLLRALLGSDADGIILLGPDAALQVVNAGALRLMEADGLADLAGRPWFDLWSGSD